MKLHWFSPLPPARSGVAEYAAMLAPHLATHADITFWTDQNEWDHSLASHGLVRQYTPETLPWDELNEGLCLYHLGNNPGAHAAIWRASQLHAGVTVVHDARLQDFFWGVVGLHDRAGYVRLMRELYGEPGQLAAGAHGTPKLTSLATRFPLIEPAIDNSLGVVVHTQPAFDIASPRFPGPIASLPLAYQPARNEKRTRRIAPPYRIVVFGHINQNRRLTSLLQALGESPARGQFRLQVCGEVWDESHLREVIAEYRLKSQVTLTGYTADLDQALAQSDLAVNLRFPSLGEASLSQLRIWDHALPSIVTRTGWYATLPPDAVLFVNPDTEIEDLKGHLEAFAADPSPFAQMGLRGQAALAAHHPKHYAADLVNFLEHAKAFRPTRAVIQTARRVGNEIGGWSGAETVNLLAGPCATALRCFLD